MKPHTPPSLDHLPTGPAAGGRPQPVEPVAREADHEVDAMAIACTLVAAAWADGKISDGEQLLLDEMLADLGLDGARAADVRRFAATPRTLADVPVDALSLPARKRVLEDVALMCLIDGHQHPQERALLRDLGARLGMEASDVAAAIGKAARDVGRVIELL